MTTIDATPLTVDLLMYAGDDWSRLFFLTLDAPEDGVYVGEWDSATVYPSSTDGTNLVTLSSVLYELVAASTNVTPGTDPTKWRAVTMADLSSYTNFAAQMRATDDAASFTVDSSQQAASIIKLSIAGTVLRDRVEMIQRWDLQADDPDGKIRTFFAGDVCIQEDATRP